MDWINENAWAGWLALALVLGAVEAATVDLVFLMLAGGALAGGGAAVAGAPFGLQVVVAVVVSLALLGIVRPIAKRRLAASADHAPIGAASYVGRTAVATTQVTSEGGRIRLDGQEWSARLVPHALPALSGSQVIVVAIDGATAVVEPRPAADPRPIGE